MLAFPNTTGKFRRYRLTYMAYDILQFNWPEFHYLHSWVFSNKNISSHNQMPQSSVAVIVCLAREMYKFMTCRFQTLARFFRFHYLLLSLCFSCFSRMTWNHWSKVLTSSPGLEFSLQLQDDELQLVVLLLLLLIATLPLLCCQLLIHCHHVLDRLCSECKTARNVNVQLETLA